MSRDISRNPAYGIKKHNADGTVNQEWFVANGKYISREKVDSLSSSHIQQPSIRPEGTEGSEWDDYAWTADDL